MKRLLISAFAFCLFFLAATDSSAQDNIWKTLSKISYKKEYDELMGFDVDIPVFSDAIKQLEGKEITVKGYFIPVEGYKNQEYFVFSAYPYNMCYFCGGAGRETVMEVYASEPVKYSAEMMTIKGKLILNYDDISKLMFILSEAEKVD